MSLPKLIVIDDEIDMAGFVSDVATQAGFDVAQFHNAGIFKEKYNKSADVIILDLIMPGVDGIEIIRYLAEIKSNALLILISGFDSGVLHSAQTLATEHGLNFAGSLNKPFRASELGELLNGLSITQKNKHSNIHIKPPPADELRSAIANNQLVVYYQPKVALNNSPEESTMTAVEALVRWQHPEHGLISPDLFVPTAEKNGLIDDLTWTVLEQALAQCMHWRDQGLIMQLAINMSAQTLKELSLPEKMGQIIQKYDLEPSQLVLEITETALMQELVKSLDILTRLRMKGFCLSIDDFGTGYSSLVQLHRAPFSEIKIDRSFVSEMETDSEAAAIVETIIMLGHKLNMKTVAEGVETLSCQKALTALGCDRAQGYLFSRPLPADKVSPWFTTQAEQT